MSDPRWPADDHSDEHPDPQAADPTQQLPAQPGGETQPPWEAEVAPRGDRGVPGAAGTGGVPPYDPEPDAEEPGRGRQVLIGVVSALAGFILAFIVIAIFTAGDDPDPVDDPALAASQERIDALEAELADRDQQVEELEARLADAEAAMGETDADLDAQREVLDERATSLDQRANALDEREAALDQRERELNDREAALAEREQQADDGPGEPDDSGSDGDGSDGDGSDGGGITPPDIDEEDVQNIVDRVLERLRDLFN